MAIPPARRCKQQDTGTRGPRHKPPGGRESLGGEGGTPLPPKTPALALPQRHSHSPTPAPTAFPTASNRPTAFTFPSNRSAAMDRQQEMQRSREMMLGACCCLLLYPSVEGTSEAAREAVGQAVRGGCQSGWGRLLSVTNAIEAGTCRQGDGGWA